MILLLKTFLVGRRSMHAGRHAPVRSIRPRDA